jgi:uncharacterized SAM-binding protein YcdF (DUF218 family)
MVDPAWIKALLKALVLPPTGPLLLSAFGVGILNRFPRAGRTLAAAGVLLLLALSVPVVAVALMRFVDTSPPLDFVRAKSAQAVVILGGGTRRNAAEYGGDTLGRLTLERVRYGARVARVTGLPVLVTGGSVLGGEAEAKLMQDSLEQEFGVGVRWAETRSRNTHENAARSAEILRAAGIDRVVLVAHAVDMPRASREFEAQGIAIIKAPTGIPASDDGGLLDYLPGIAGLQGSYYALYEIVALGVGRVIAAK